MLVLWYCIGGDDKKMIKKRLSYGQKITKVYNSMFKVFGRHHLKNEDVATIGLSLFCSVLKDLKDKFDEKGIWNLLTIADKAFVEFKMFPFLKEHIKYL